MTITAYLPTGGADLIAARPVSEPQPADDAALVAVEAFSINRGEILLLRDGRLTAPGKDVAGRVLGQAADGSGPPSGSRVVAHLDGGGWAEQVAVPASRLVVLPDSISMAEAVALPLAGLTALRLFEASEPTPGRRILITGASGGVGHAYVELAAGAGAQVTAVTASPMRGRGLLSRGAARVIQDVSEAGGGFDLMLESVGGATFAAAVAQLRRGGELVWFGQASGVPVTIDFFSVVYGPGEVIFRTFAYADTPDRDREDLERLVGLVAGGRLHPELGLVADWTDTPTVLADLFARRVTGNAVLTLNGRRTP